MMMKVIGFISIVCLAFVIGWTLASGLDTPVPTTVRIITIVGLISLAIFYLSRFGGRE